MDCLLPKNKYEQIVLAHGGGGKLSKNLLDSLIIPILTNSPHPTSDSAAIKVGKELIALTTDSFVVTPPIFPGGDIGSLAVHGTVNDISVSGATPIALSCALIIEEGVSLRFVESILKSMKQASDKAGVPIITGDTKVVERGSADKMYITTTGIGLFHTPPLIHTNIKPGNAILINGTIGDHGVAVLSARERLEFDNPPKSDSCALNALIESISKSFQINFMRDPTRGGVASSLNELATIAKVGMEIEESMLPISKPVESVAALLGLDPLHIANEGKVLFFVNEKDKDLIIKKLKKHPLGRDSAVIGKVVDNHIGQVVLNTAIGSTRIIDMISGEQLPRIC